MIDSVYILSFGRSGSTLLNLILGTHPQATAIGEITHLPKNLALNTPCTCGAAVRECPFWARVVELLDERLGLELGRTPYALELGFINASRVIDHAHQTKVYRALWKLRHGIVLFGYKSGVPVPRWARSRFDLGNEHTCQLYDAIRETSGVPLIVDASKVYTKGIALHLKAPTRSRLILLSRDGRAVMYSHLRSGFNRRQAVQGWKRYYLRTLPILARYVPQEQIIRIRYEELMTDPEAQARRLCEFLELSYDPAMLDFGSKVHHLTNGNEMRFTRSPKIVADRAWQKELTATDLAYFEREAGALNRMLGYE